MGLQSMPVLQTIRKQFIKTQPLAGHAHRRLPARHQRDRQPVITLRDGGASVVLCASNPLSTQDDVAATLVRDYGIPTFTPSKARTTTSTTPHPAAAVEHQPHITMDDGADLVTLLHTKRKDLATRA